MQLRRDSGLILLALLLFGSLGVSSSGGGYTTFVKFDFLAGNTTDTRVGAGQQPAASFGDNTTVLCGRLGVLDALACATTPVPVKQGTCGSGEDWLPKNKRVGLRRLNWLQSGGRNVYIYPLPS